MANTFFGAVSLDKYRKDTLTYELYRKPDAVLSDTYHLKVAQTWGPFEKSL